MVTRRNFHMGFVLAALQAVLVGVTCTTEPAPPNGTCVVDPGLDPPCGASLDAGSSEALGLVAYSCTGSARPDDDPKYIEGVPEGLVCADRGPQQAGGTRSFCCTAYSTPCAYDALADCEAPTYGYQCLGANRPEALNPAIFCGQGVREGDYINYCCSGTLQPDGCQQSDSVVCSSRQVGWTCLGNSLPRSEQLGPNKSRSDLYHFLCPIPTPAANPEYNNYCCFVPAPRPIGASCVQHTSVPGCAPGRFGFACYGPDTPDEDYLPVHCPEPGFPGRSAEGYPATLYCCDFR